MYAHLTAYTLVSSGCAFHSFGEQADN